MSPPGGPKTSTPGKPQTECGKARAGFSEEICPDDGGARNEPQLSSSSTQNPVNKCFKILRHCRDTLSGQKVKLCSECLLMQQRDSHLLWMFLTCTLIHMPAPSSPVVRQDKIERETDKRYCYYPYTEGTLQAFTHHLAMEKTLADRWKGILT